MNALNYQTVKRTKNTIVDARLWWKDYHGKGVWIILHRIFLESNEVKRMKNFYIVELQDSTPHLHSLCGRALPRWLIRSALLALRFAFPSDVKKRVKKSREMVRIAQKRECDWGNQIYSKCNLALNPYTSVEFRPTSSEHTQTYFVKKQWPTLWTFCEKLTSIIAIFIFDQKKSLRTNCTGKRWF